MIVLVETIMAANGNDVTKVVGMGNVANGQNNNDVVGVYILQ